MKGCTFKRILPSGKISWGYSIDAGKDEAGQRHQIFKSGFTRQSDADTALAQVLQEKTDGLLVRPNPRTSAQFIEEWFREHAAQCCTPKTVECYRQLAGYILPRIGNVPLQDVSALLLERVYNQLLQSGGSNRRAPKSATGKPLPAPLSARTVHHVHGLLHAALGVAVRWKFIKVNPADACELPKVQPREARALDAAQTTWFLDAARGTWLYPILVLAAATGSRRGELLALTWANLDLEVVPGLMRVSHSLEQTAGGLRVKSTKSGKARTLPLPAIAVTVLKEHRAEQDEFRRQFGLDYRADLDLVFARPDGEYMKPDSVTATACRLARKAGLKGIGLHSLRHSHGSQLLAAGVGLATVSRRLGHSNVGITAAVYSHAFTRDELAAADTWNATMTQAIEQQHVRQ